VTKKAIRSLQRLQECEQAIVEFELCRSEQIDRRLVFRIHMRFDKLDAFTPKPTANFQHKSLSVTMTALRFGDEDFPNANAADAPLGNEQVHADNLATRDNFKVCLFLQLESQ
jgi:hypothetical protein